MNKRYIGFFISKNTNSAAIYEDIENWFRAEHSEMHEWIIKNAKSKWGFSSVYYGDVDTKFFGKLTAFRVSIEYEDARDAVLHKLRWE